MTIDKHEELVEGSKAWILEKFDQKVLDASELDYRFNDEITCAKVIGANGSVKGILTVWKENRKLQYHFDKR